MRRWTVVALLLSAAGLSLDPPAADAQPAQPVVESFPTADGVLLRGLFHKSPNGAKQKDAVVVLLYPPGPERDMFRGDWDGLIAKLNDAGFHVFRFDWRGHGQSTTIVDPLGDNTPFNGFWTNQITGQFNQRFVKGANTKPAKNDLRVKTDIRTPNYFPVYVNDLAAVRLHLDLKNDQGELSTDSIYLIGAGDTAMLGMLWMAAEWQRPGVGQMLIGGGAYRVVPRDTVVAPPNPAGGADIAGAVWLSASRPPMMPDAVVKSWVAKSPRLRDENKMLFMYGEADMKAKTESEALFHKVLVAGGNNALGLAPINQTFLDPIAKAGLNGLALLGRKLDPQPETKAVEFLTAVQKRRMPLIAKNRNWIIPYYIDVTRFGIAP